MDELWDEGAVDGEGSAEAGIGAALLMADLEAAIAAAGDEIAALGRVTEAAPRPGLPSHSNGAAGAVPDPTASGLGAASPAVAVSPPSSAEELATGRPAVESLQGSIRTDGNTSASAGLAGSSQPLSRAPVAFDAAAPVRPGVASGFVSGPATGGGTDGLTPTPPTSNAPVPFGAERLQPSPGTQAQAELGEPDRPGPPVAPVWPTAPGPADQPGELPQSGDDEAVLAEERAPVSQAAPVGRFGPRPHERVENFGPPSLAEPGGREAAGRQAEGEAAARGGPTEGDVYLDGERVGRWMARHLARELGGPQAAGTGFDPRLGPAWPGSLHGN